MAYGRFECVRKSRLSNASIPVKFSSVFFMVITIAAYLWLPKFRSLHGKCCNLYFICLAITFLLNVISLFGIFELKTPICYLTDNQMKFFHHYIKYISIILAENCRICWLLHCNGHFSLAFRHKFRCLEKIRHAKVPGLLQEQKEQFL